MRVFRSIDEIPAKFGPTVAAIGNFDGLHCGHREVLAAVVTEARTEGAQAVAVTFDPHPEQYLRPELAPKLLTLLPERLALLEATGVDAVLVLPFDEGICNLRARAFVESILVARLGVIRLHEGANFRFGCKAEAGGRRTGRVWPRIWLWRRGARCGHSAWARGFEFGDSQGGGRGRAARSPMDAGAEFCRALQAGAGARDWHAAGRSYGEPGSLCRAAAGDRRVRDPAHSRSRK